MRKFLIALVVLTANTAWADYRGELSFGYITGDVSVSGSPGYTPPSPGDPGDPGDPPPVGTPPIEPPPISESSGDDDYDGWQVAGEYFLEPVDTSLGPRRLAAFLARASSVGGSYSELNTDDSDVETETWTLFTRLVVGEGWVLEGAFGQSDVDAGISDEDVDLYRAAVGYYVAASTQVRIGFDVEDADSIEYERWAVDITHVQQLENGMTWQAELLYGDVQGDVDVGGDDDGSDLAVNLSLYFTDAFGVGVDYMAADRDLSGDTDAWEVWTNYFPTDKISLTLSYFDEENDDLDAETDGVVFEAKYRF